MKTFKKMILTALCACCAWIAGVATLGINKEVKTASAAVATDYTVVDTSVLAKLEDVYVANGNFRIYITFPQMDTDVKNGDVIKISSPSGYHILFKCAPTDNAYDIEANKVWFSSFATDFAGEIFADTAEPYMAQIKLNEKVYAKVPNMKEIATNYFYY
jgi:hypothetical protein